MRAVVKTERGPGRVELREMPEPTPGPEEVKIAVAACGICGTDVHIYHDTYPYVPPVILGHELSGSIVAVGERVEGLAVGDRVTVESHATVCGRCLYCHQGLEKLCGQRRALGRAADGGMAEYLVIRASMVHRLPPEVDFNAGALTQLAACAYHAVVEQTGIQAGEVVVVFGPGATGLLSAQVARAQGAFVVVCGTTRSRPRLELAARLGADMILNIQEDDVPAAIREVTGGLGADVVVECSGSPAAVDTGLEVVRKAGRYTQMGFVGREMSLNPDRIVHKDLTFRGVAGYKWTSWDGALKLLARQKVTTAPLVGAELPLEAWEEGFRMNESREAIRVILHP